jgi:hypothetical protein
MSKLDNYIKNIKIEYYKIKSIRCYILSSENVFFNNVGFRHLIRKGGIKRPVLEQKRRFKLLKYCRTILTSEDVSVEYRTSKKEKSKVEFWGITAIINKRKIRVIIRRINDGKLIFLSVMDFK